MSTRSYVVYRWGNFPHPAPAPNEGTPLDEWIGHHTADAFFKIKEAIQAGNDDEAITVLARSITRAALIGKHLTVRVDEPEQVAWAWTCEGMSGWALGHLKPTPENTPKFHERKTIVRPLTFLPFPPEG
jgi:hypothetical protein